MITENAPYTGVTSCSTQVKSQNGPLQQVMTSCMQVYMSPTALRLEHDPESSFRWSLELKQGAVLLTLCGSRHKMKAGSVTAVADGGHLQVQLQCHLSIKLLYPDMVPQRGVSQLCPKPLPLNLSEYNSFRARILSQSPTTTVQVESMPHGHAACASMLIPLDTATFSMCCLPAKLRSALEARKAGAALCVAAALAWTQDVAGKQQLVCMLKLMYL